MPTLKCRHCQKPVVLYGWDLNDETPHAVEDVYGYKVEQLSKDEDGNVIVCCRRCNHDHFLRRRDYHRIGKCLNPDCDAEISLAAVGDSIKDLPPAPHVEKTEEGEQVTCPKCGGRNLFVRQEGTLIFYDCQE